MKLSNRIIAGVLCFVITLYSVSSPFVASAGLGDAFQYGVDTLNNWISGSSSEPLGGWNLTDWSSALFSSNKPQAYYTTPTESVEDKYGNVTNYYRGGDTTTTKIIDSYNHTFNTIHNVSNTNNYSANVQLENFLNNYTTNNNNYTYNTEYKSWYYDNTSNTYNYDASQTYYNTDNSQYYISIDNSTDEYYLVDVKYSPTFVTVNYTYNTTNNTTNNYGNVTNVYYYELTDGRNSADLSADDVLGLDLGYDVANYELITDDDSTLSLQHFDGDYTDSSSYGRTFYSENRSTNYVDSGEFGKAVKLSSGSAAGVTIPGLSGYDGLTFDFRVYYDKIDSLGIYLGDTNLFQRFVKSKSCYFLDFYSDVGTTFSLGRFCRTCYNSACGYPHFTSAGSKTSGLSLSKSISNEHTPPTSSYSGWTASYSDEYGYFDDNFDVEIVSQSDQCEWGTLIQDFDSAQTITVGSTAHSTFNFSINLVNHYRDTRYKATPTNSSRNIPVDFSYSAYANQWVPMRITIDDGKLYYFVNGDLVGSGAFTMPVADKFYIKSSGTLYLDELRITAGDMVYTSSYVPSNAPYDTNKVLALPSELVEDVIYVRSSIPVTAWRVGGVRPSNPSKGFVYIPIYSDNTGGQSQIYDGNNWVNIDSVVYNGSVSVTTKGFKFSPVGDSLDISTDNSSGSGSSDSDSPSTSCTHDWELTESVEGEYDLYTCKKCSKQHYDYDQSGTPPSSSSDSSDSSSSFLKWLGEKLGELFGAIADGFITLLESTLGVVLDSLISLVTSTIERLTKIASLFGSFANSLGALWSWLPPEIAAVLTAGVTIFVFIAVIRFFMK